MSKFTKVVAIDGPSGSGKSTVAKLLAKSLDYLYIDTGAMYRAIGYAADSNNIPFQEGAELKSFLSELKFEYGIDSKTLVVVNGENLTEKIREHHVSKLASDISKLPIVRDFLFQTQRSLGEKSFSVMEGRDIGTVVFPDAFIKVFLTASLDERTKRRQLQLEKNGEKHEYDKIYEDVKQRDYNDTNRDIAPLKQADDGILFDTTAVSQDDVILKLEEMIQDRIKSLGL